jgi:GxxExxY protein
MYVQDKIKRKDLLHPELSYAIIGALLAVYKELGPGLPENVYQRAVAEELRRRGVKFREQVSVRLFYKDVPVGIYYADFIIEEKIVLELKTFRFFSRKNIDQTIGYLKSFKLQLGILANFTRNGLEYKRIINIEQ